MEIDYGMDVRSKTRTAASGTPLGGLVVAVHEWDEVDEDTGESFGHKVSYRCLDAPGGRPVYHDIDAGDAELTSGVVMKHVVKSRLLMLAADMGAHAHGPKHDHVAAMLVLSNSLNG